MADEPTFAVEWPLGRLTKDVLPAGKGLSQVDGKRIAFVWDYVFRGDEMFEIIKEELASRGHEVEFVDYHVFGDTHGADETAVVADIPNKILEYRVDAAIVGVGA